MGAQRSSSDTDMSGNTLDECVACADFVRQLAALGGESLLTFAADKLVHWFAAEASMFLESDVEGNRSLVASTGKVSPSRNEAVLRELSIGSNSDGQPVCGLNYIETCSITTSDGPLTVAHFPLMTAEGVSLAQGVICQPDNCSLPTEYALPFEVLRQQLVKEFEKRKLTSSMEHQLRTAVRGERLRALGEMSCSMAHEFNQPLSGIRGYAENLLISIQRGWDVQDEEITGKMEKIVELTDRMSSLIDHIREFSRQAEEYNLQPVNVGAVMDVVLSLIQAQLRAHAINLVYENKARGARTTADFFRLEEVFIELIYNARDALYEVPDLAPDFTRQIEISLDADKENEFIVLAITDNGAGIPPDILSRAFEPFVTTKGPTNGTGLGLTGAKTTIVKLGGSLELQSVVDSGTTALVKLPLVDFVPEEQ